MTGQASSPSQSQFRIQLICYGLLLASTPPWLPRAFWNKSKLLIGPMSPCQCLSLVTPLYLPSRAMLALTTPQNMGRKDFSLASMAPGTQSILLISPLSLLPSPGDPPELSGEAPIAGWLHIQHPLAQMQGSASRELRDADRCGGLGHPVREVGRLPTCRKQLLWETRHLGPDLVHGLGRSLSRSETVGTGWPCRVTFLPLVSSLLYPLASGK